MLPFFLVFGFAGIVKEMTAGINAIIKIDTKDLSSGIYLVQCHNRGELVNVKQLLVR